MTGKRGCVGHDHVVAEPAVVSDMGLGHDQAIVTDLGEHAAACSPAMNCDEFTNLISFADSGLRRLALVLQILRAQVRWRRKGKM